MYCTGLILITIGACCMDSDTILIPMMIISSGIMTVLAGVVRRWLRNDKRTTRRADKGAHINVYSGFPY